MRIELNTFAPDLDPQTPGIITECLNMVPTTKGLTARFGGGRVNLPVLTSLSTGGFVANLLDGTRRTFVGSQTYIYEAGATSWTDRSAMGGYSGTNRWRWAVFGNNVLATNKSEAIQQAVPSGNFAAIVGAPKAAIIEPVAGFIMAFDYNDGTDTPDGWFCSALFDQTDWTPSIATQSANGRLLETPGRIVAGKALGSDIVAYKSDSMYLGRYVGPPLIWQWQRIPGRIGTFSQESVVVADNRHWFVGADDFWMFDGTRPVSIGAPVREWFFRQANPDDRFKIWALHDEPRGMIWWYYYNGNTTRLNKAIVYNYKLNRWGHVDSQIDIPFAYASGQVTYDGLGSKYTTYEDLPSIAYDSPFWLSGGVVPAVISGGSIFQLTARPNPSSYTTGYFGDMVNVQMLRRFKPRWRGDVPTTAFATNRYTDSLNDNATDDATISVSRGRFDFRRAARFHQVRVSHQGFASVDGAEVELVGASRE